MDKLIECLDRQFAELHNSSRELIAKLSPALLYRDGGRGLNEPQSCGEYILRSAAIVEQTFGGLTANLWDDPFEWTLPETLPTPAKVAEYLDEVEATRKLGFELFQRDEDLLKEIMAPAGKTELLGLLLDTLVRAVHHQGRAVALFKMLRAEHTLVIRD